MLSAVPGWQVVLALVVHDFVAAPRGPIGVSWVLVLVVHDFVAAPRGSVGVSWVLVLVVHDFVAAPLGPIAVSWVLVLVVHDFVAAPGAASWFGGTVWCVVAAVRHLGSSFNRSEPVATGPDACSCVGSNCASCGAPATMALTPRRRRRPVCCHRFAASPSRLSSEPPAVATTAGDDWSRIVSTAGHLSSASPRSSVLYSCIVPRANASPARHDRPSRMRCFSRLPRPSRGSW
jgi:hypothetical protein